MENHRIHCSGQSDSQESPELSESYYINILYLLYKLCCSLIILVQQEVEVDRVDLECSVTGPDIFRSNRIL